MIVKRCALPAYEKKVLTEKDVDVTLKDTSVITRDQDESIL